MSDELKRAHQRGGAALVEVLKTACRLHDQLGQLIDADDRDLREIELLASDQSVRDALADYQRSLQTMIASTARMQKQLDAAARWASGEDDGTRE